jgi:hypothetical protein
MATSNILIFSVWYWLIDPAGIEDVSRADEPWDFLFPQRSSPLPHYDGWVPRYADYLFVAFTTRSRQRVLQRLVEKPPPGS